MKTLYWDEIEFSFIGMEECVYVNDEYYGTKSDFYKDIDDGKIEVLWASNDSQFFRSTLPKRIERESHSDNCNCHACEGDERSVFSAMQG